METFISYLIQASAGIVLFYMGYWLFLRNETYHNANRWFLLAALLSSVLLPLFPVHYTVFMEQGSRTNILTTIPDTFQHLPTVAGQESVAGSFNWQQAVLLIYFTGAVIFLLRLLTQTIILIQLMGMQIIGVTNNLNFFLNTNRLKMMTKTKTSRFSGIKFLWALPAVALLLFAFAESVYKANNPETKNPVSTFQKAKKEFVMKGKVIRDETGKPLHGASVIIKGTTVGTISDENGNFILVDPNPKKGKNGGYFTDVVISFVGRETKLITVSSVENELEITIPDIKMKDGVIVINSDDFGALTPPPPPPLPAKQGNNIPAPPPPPINNQEPVFFVVEELPEYPGGFYALGEYITEMQRKFVQSNNVSGKSKIGFTVSESGKVTDVKIVEKDNDEVGKAAATIVMNMKDWKPGKQRGKPVPVKYLLPLEFN